LRHQGFLNPTRGSQLGGTPAASRDKYLFSAAAVAGLWCDSAFLLKSFLAEKKKPRDG
jgi:hypothetical protein